MLVFAMTMMAGLVVSLAVRRRRIWIRIAPRDQVAGTVNVELGGLARTDNSGWGDEFERLRDTTMRSTATKRSGASRGARLLAGQEEQRP